MQNRMMNWLKALICALCVAMSLPAPVQAQAPSNDEEARVHFRLGTAYYDSGRFAQAAEEFKQAYDLSQRPQLLYNLFLAYRDAGDIRNAANALRQYLTDVSEVEDRGKLEARLAALDKILENQAPEPEKKSEPEPVAQPAAAEATTNAPQPEEPKKLTWLPWTLMGAGGALIVTGITVGALGLSDESALEKDCPSPDKCSLTDKEVDDLKSSGSLKTSLGDALWITGALTAGVGVAFMFWKPWERSSASGDSNVSLTCGPGLCGGSYSQRF